MVRLLLILLLTNTTFGADYYVSNSGDDSANGTSDKTAWKTLSRIEKVELKPGDIVHLVSGNIWHESLRLTRSGTAEKPIRIVCDPPADRSTIAMISGDDSDGKSVRDYCIDIAASYISIEGIRISAASNPERGAIMVWADRDRTDISIRYCWIEKNHGRGIWVAGDQGKTVSNIFIENNEFWDNDGSPIQIARMKGGKISHNLMSGNTRKVVDEWQAGIRLWSSDISDVEVSANRVENQVFGLKKSQGMGVHIDEVGPNVVVKDNDISGSDTVGILVENTQGVQVVNNIITGVHTGIFCYRAGHDLLISRNLVQATSLGIVLQGHRANGVDAGPEIEKNGLLFTKNRIEHNLATANKDACLKLTGGAEKAILSRDENIIDQNCFGIERANMFEFGDRYLESIRQLEAIVGATHSIAYPRNERIILIDAGATRPAKKD